MSSQKKVNVLFIWDVKDILKDYLRKGLQDFENVQLIFPPDIEQVTLLEFACDADIVVGWRPSEELLDAAQRMSLFINPGAGVQHLIERFRKLNKKRSIILVNGHGNSYFAAQHAVALLLALMNKVIPHHNWMVDGEWRKGDDDAISLPLRDRTIGFLGYGAVNQKVHRFLSGFSASFAAVRRDWDVQRGNSSIPLKKYNTSEFNDFLGNIDTLIIAVPQTRETKGYIKERELTLLGSHGLLVNVGRGVVIDEKDLFEALKNKTIAGAAIDVWYDYRPEPDREGKRYPFSCPFHELDNVVLSPHRAASPFSDLRRWDEVVENIQRFSRKENTFLNEVDLEREY